MKLGIMMDPLSDIRMEKDSSLALLLAAARRGWELQYMEPGDLYLRDSVPRARMRTLHVQDDPSCWYRFLDEAERDIGSLDVILMRKDPPVTTEYFYLGYLLELAEYAGCLVVNSPRGVRSANEKLLVCRFPELCPPTLVSRDRERFLAFLAQHREVIVKPLDAMGGRSVFKLCRGDPNVKVILEEMTKYGSRFVMGQRYVPEVRNGDKRIFLIDGEPVQYALLRIPPPGEERANLVAGGSYRGVEIDDSDRRICRQLKPVLQELGLLFVGLDVIGGFLTEINVTSPTGIRELKNVYSLDVAEAVLDGIECKLAY